MERTGLDDARDVVQDHPGLLSLAVLDGYGDTLPREVPDRRVVQVRLGNGRVLDVHYGLHLGEGGRLGPGHVGKGVIVGRHAVKVEARRAEWGEEKKQDRAEAVGRRSPWSMPPPSGQSTVRAFLSGNIATWDNEHGSPHGLPGAGAL